MQLTDPGNQTPIDWPSGFGTISIQDTHATDFEGIGDFNGATIIFQASFDGGKVWDEMKDGSGDQVIFDTTTRVKNFSLSACKIRAVVTGDPSGSGVRLGINRRA